MSIIATQQIGVGCKTNEIAKFSILDKKTNIQNFGQNLDENQKYRRICDEICDFRRTKNAILDDISCVPKHAGCTTQNECRH